MRKITKGPLTSRYADCFGIDEDEVVEWINSYVFRPGEWVQLVEAGLMEATEQERMASIKAYIEREISESTYGRVKAALDKERTRL